MMREPLVWFFVIGVLLFAADSFMQEEQIIVDDGVRQHLAGLWQTQMGKAPAPGQMESLVDNWIREEVMYRHAMAMGLDENDTIIRRRLVQKLGFIAQDISQETLSAEDIEEHYLANREKFELAARYSFSQVFFKEADRAGELESALKAGSDWQSLSDTSMLQARFLSRSREEVRGALGSGFADSLDELSLGQWIRVDSSYGHHLVRLDRLDEAYLPPLQMVHKKVVADLQRQRATDALNEYYLSLKENYEIVYE